MAATEKTSEQPLILRATGSRRVVVGPLPRSVRAEMKGGGEMIRFDTPADEGVPAGQRLGSVHQVTGEHARLLRDSKVLKAVGAKLGLQVA